MRRLIPLVFSIFSFLALGQKDSVKIFGHRGCRAYYPENSIIGFRKAIEMGVDGVELDVVVNKDKQLVISHEPYFQREFCLDGNGQKIESEKAFNIYEMTQEEIRSFDCGSIGNPKFPEQRALSVHKPLLKELFDSVDLSGVTILFEIKSESNEYGRSQPKPEEYVQIILKELEDFPYRQNIVFMSFDSQILNEINRQTKEFRMVHLTYLPFRSVKRFLNDLEFKPFALGMFYPTVNRRKSKKLHKQGLKLFSWTVNETKTAVKLMRKGVDGIITDRPKEVSKEISN